MTKKIPDFKSLEEAAEYWDTHSFADHLDDTSPVEIEVRLERRKISLDMNNDLSDKLNKIAKSKKKSCSKLIRSWIIEKINQETAF